MAIHPNSLKNLQTHPKFSTEIQPANRVHKSGQNSKTIIREVLDTETDYTDAGGNNLGKLPIAKQIVLKQAYRAIVHNDTNAAMWLFERGYGKVGSENDTQAPLITYDLSNATDEELTKMGECLAYVNSLHVKYRIDPNAHIEEAEQVR